MAMHQNASLKLKIENASKLVFGLGPAVGGCDAAPDHIVGWGGGYLSPVSYFFTLLLQ